MSPEKRRELQNYLTKLMRDAESLDFAINSHETRLNQLLARKMILRDKIHDVEEKLRK